MVFGHSWKMKKLGGFWRLQKMVEAAAEATTVTDLYNGQMWRGTNQRWRASPVISFYLGHFAFGTPHSGEQSSNLRHSFPESSQTSSKTPLLVDLDVINCLTMICHHIWVLIWILPLHKSVGHWTSHFGLGLYFFSLTIISFISYPPPRLQNI